MNIKSTDIPSFHDINLEALSDLGFTAMIRKHRDHPSNGVLYRCTLRHGEHIRSGYGARVDYAIENAAQNMKQHLERLEADPK